MDELMNGQQHPPLPQNHEQSPNYRNGRKIVTKEDFYLFCKVVLEHTNYDEMMKAERESRNSPEDSNSLDLDANGDSTIENNNSSFEESDLNGTYDTNDQYSTENNSTTLEGGEDNIDTFNSVTCFCKKPFAGRPMIECSGCLTWLHMSCVKVKRKNVPEFFYCDKCKTSGASSSSSNEELGGVLGVGGLGMGLGGEKTGMKATTKGSKSELKVKQKKIKKNVLSKMKAANSMFRNVNLTEGGEKGFLNSLKKSSMNGMRKLKKIKKMNQSLSPTKMISTAVTTNEIGITSTPRPNNVSPIAATTATTSINQRVLEIGDSIAETNGMNGYYLNDTGATTMETSSTTSTSIIQQQQQSLVNNNNHLIKYSDLAPEQAKSTNSTSTATSNNNFNGTITNNNNDTTNELFNKQRIKLS